MVLRHVGVLLMTDSCTCLLLVNIDVNLWFTLAVRPSPPRLLGIRIGLLRTCGPVTATRDKLLCEALYGVTPQLWLSRAQPFQAGHQKKKPLCILIGSVVVLLNMMLEIRPSGKA